MARASLVERKRPDRTHSDPVRYADAGMMPRRGAMSCHAVFKKREISGSDKRRASPGRTPATERVNRHVDLELSAACLTSLSAGVTASDSASSPRGAIPSLRYILVRVTTDIERSHGPGRQRDGLETAEPDFGFIVALRWCSDAGTVRRKGSKMRRQPWFRHCSQPGFIPLRSKGGRSRRASLVTTSRAC